MARENSVQDTSNYELNLDTCQNTIDTTYVTRSKT